MSKNLSHLSGRQGLKNNLFEKIGHLSEHEGTLSKEQKIGLAEEYLIGKANITGTISAYDFTREENRGKKHTSVTAQLVCWPARKTRFVKN
jgi:hypothetical protein